MVIQCPHNAEVTCGPYKKDMDCKTCGWNPKVAKERLKALRNEENQEDN